MGIHLQFQTGCSTQGCWWGSQGWGVTSVPGSSPQPCPRGHRGVLCACGWGGDLSHMDIRVRRMLLASPTCPGPAPREQGGGFGVYLPILLLSCPVGSGTLLWLFATSLVSHGFFGCWTRLRCAGCSVMQWGRLPSPGSAGFAPCGTGHCWKPKLLSFWLTGVGCPFFWGAGREVTPCHPWGAPALSLGAPGWDICGALWLCLAGSCPHTLSISEGAEAIISITSIFLHFLPH